MEVQKGVQCTCQAEKGVRSSFTPSVALLVHPSSTVHPIVDFHGHKHDARERRSSGSIKVWLSCLAKTGFQFLHYYVWLSQIQLQIFSYDFQN